MSPLGFTTQHSAARDARAQTTELNHSLSFPPQAALEPWSWYLYWPPTGCGGIGLPTLPQRQSETSLQRSLARSRSLRPPQTRWDGHVIRAHHGLRQHDDKV